MSEYNSKGPSMAIAYAMQKRKHMARGGEPEMCAHGSTDCHMCHGGRMADGGMVHEEEESGYRSLPHEHAKHNEEADREDEDIVERIMRKRMSKGGMVANDIDDEADFESNDFDDMEKDDHLEQHDTEANSGDDLGDEAEDHDRHDIVARIMRSRAKRDRMPRPA